MIVKAAKKAAGISGVPFDDLKAQADMLFVVACRRYREHRGVKFSTFLHTVLHNGLVDFGKHECAHDNVAYRFFGLPDDEREVTDTIPDERTCREYGMVDFYQSLSADERELVNLLLDGFASSLTGLKRLALERLGYEEARFEEAVEGIRELVRELN